MSRSKEAFSINSVIWSSSPEKSTDVMNVRKVGAMSRKNIAGRVEERYVFANDPMILEAVDPVVRAWFLSNSGTSCKIRLTAVFDRRPPEWA